MAPYEAVDNGAAVVMGVPVSWRMDYGLLVDPNESLLDDVIKKISAAFGLPEITKELEKVYNRGFSTNFLLGTPTNDSWNKFYGSIAKEKKVRLGKITNYFAKIKVVSILLDEQLKENDEICFTGNKTGYYKLKVKEIRFENKPVKSAKKGQEISIKLDEQIRKSDEVYLIQERNINQEEKRIEQELKKFRAHKPFKSIKNV